MLLDSIDRVPISQQIKFQCDKCECLSERTKASIKQSWYRTGTKEVLCTKCSRLLGAGKRPQNNREFVRMIGSSKAYYEGIKNRPQINGSNNPMFGKQHTEQTRKKMSLSRTGKVGENATAWKGGKLSLNRRIKSAVQRRYRWFSRVITRDSCCTECGAAEHLDAHHIVPLSKLIKNVISEREFLSDTEKYEFIVNHEQIKDTLLSNGITLCRKCHRKAHQNWGSHEPKRFVRK